MYWLPPGEAIGKGDDDRWHALFADQRLRPEDDGAPEPIGAAADSPEAILAGLAVLWEVDIGDTPLAVTFDPAAPPC